MVVAENVHKSYGKFHALKGVSLSVDRINSVFYKNWKMIGATKAKNA